MGADPEGVRGIYFLRVGAGSVPCGQNGNGRGEIKVKPFIVEGDNLESGVLEKESSKVKKLGAATALHSRQTLTSLHESLN